MDPNNPNSPVPPSQPSTPSSNGMPQSDSVPPVIPPPPTPLSPVEPTPSNPLPPVIPEPVTPSLPAAPQPASSTLDDATSLVPPQPLSPTDAASQAPTFPPTTDPLTEEVEKELVSHIIENLEGSKLTVEDAQTLAQEFLALLPFEDKHDLVQKLNILSQKYNEAKAVYVKYAGPLEEADRLRKISEMAAHIKAGNLDEALAVAKGGENGTGNTISGATNTTTS